MRMLKKDRPENDPTKALEFAGAMTDLAQAFKVFRHLRKLGPKLSGIEEEKAEKHLIFCQQTHEKGTLLLQQASRRPFIQSNAVTASQPTTMPATLWHTFKLSQMASEGTRERPTTNTEDMRLVTPTHGHAFVSQCLLIRSGISMGNQLDST